MFTIVIQAGGKSRRMGRDKGLVLFKDRPLIERVINRVQNSADELLVTTNHPENYSFLGLPMHKDIVPNRGALGGLYTALSAASNPLVAVLACDMPFINVALLEYERDQMVNEPYDIVIPKTNAGLEPFHAVYRRETCLHPIKSALDARLWRVDCWFKNMKVLIIPPEQLRKYDQRLLSFLNVNTPNELKKAEQIASQIPDE
ncbi:MAG: molybdenum cofactor guanylyltransferase [Anaerolineales bacterium]